MRKYTVLAAFFVGALSAAPLAPDAFAADDDYTVAGVKVDATAANAVTARQKAFEQAQQAAFVQLATHFLQPDQMKNFQAPDATMITPLVDDFEITNEQLSTTRYVGTYTFKFRHNARQLIDQREDAAQAATAAQAAAAAAPPANPAQPPQPGNEEFAGMKPASTIPARNPMDGVYNPNAETAAAPVAEPAGNVVKVRVRFATMRDWIQTQQSLRRVAGVSSVETESLSTGQAVVGLHYQGSETALRAGLSQMGMGLMGGTPDNSGVYGDASAGGIVYDLGTGYAGTAPASGMPSGSVYR